MLALKAVVCLSTQFGHIGDGHGGRTNTRYTGVPVTPADVGIAHRTLPISTIVLVKNLRTQRQSFALVIDRGPYGKLDAEGRWFNSRKERERVGTYRGCADLTPSLTERIGHNGREEIRLSWWKGFPTVKVARRAAVEFLHKLIFWRR